MYNIGDIVLRTFCNKKSVWKITKLQSESNCVLARRWIKTTRKWSGSEYSLGCSNIVPMTSPEA
jgi:hypothetical protein